MSSGRFGLVAMCGLVLSGGAGAEERLSPATRECLECHEEATPGIVADWRESRHARTTPRKAWPDAGPDGRFPEGAGDFAVGCAECHTASPGTHRDSFEHEGHSVHVVVTPTDCALCHAVEAAEYRQNKMAHAYGNLMRNPLYRDLVDQVVGLQALREGAPVTAEAGEVAQGDSCLACHGTVVEVAGAGVRQTGFGEMSFPVLKGWPNGGVGRVNPDGSLGSCAACHTRHRFAVSEARRPAACAKCHKGPDVPAYPVYQVSKHGARHQTASGTWNDQAVPWVVGRDLTAPTCATCHISRLDSPGGQTLVTRTHRMNDRLSWRIFGLPYAHPQPESPDTTVLRNRQGLPLPTELNGDPVGQGLIGPEEMDRREATMKRVCQACHGEGWVAGHFERFHQAIADANAMTRLATDIVVEAWKQGLARGPGQGSPFDEPIERRWVEQWLFYGNSVRFASAMAGADYGVFAGGRWQLSRNLREMIEWLQDRRQPGSRGRPQPRSVSPGRGR